MVKFVSWVLQEHCLVNGPNFSFCYYAMLFSIFLNFDYQLCFHNVFFETLNLISVASCVCFIDFEAAHLPVENFHEIRAPELKLFG